MVVRVTVNKIDLTVKKTLRNFNSVKHMKIYIIISSSKLKTQYLTLSTLDCIPRESINFYPLDLFNPMV